MSQNNSIANINPQDAGLAAEAATRGDLSALTPDQRTQLYGATCRSMGLNPLSRPFEYIKLNGKLTLYATRTATDQLRKINGVSITNVEKEVFDGVLTVTVYATDATGRTDMEIGAVPTGGLKGEALANAHMKALTKAKRRVTLSISGLGWLDETEVSSVPTAANVMVNHDTGEIGEPSYSNESQSALAKLHAVAGKQGISHDDLHRWATQTVQVPSLRDVEPRWLKQLADKLADDAKAAEFRAKYTPPSDDAVIDAEVVEVESVGLFDDDELAALNAAADRDMAASKARA